MDQGSLVVIAFSQFKMTFNEIVDIALRIQPGIVCIVPERRQEVTTEGGLDAAGQVDALQKTTSRMKDAGIEVAPFKKAA